jgi:hypothetical protein
MNERLRWLTSIVLALAFLDGSLALLDRREEKAHEYHAGDPLVAFEPAGVAKVTLTRPNKKPLVLARTQGGSWVVATAKDFPVRPNKVEQTLARMKTWKRDRIAGDSAVHDKFAVTKDKGISVKVEDFAGQTLSEVIIGSLTGVDTEEARKNSGNLDPKTMGRYMREAREDAVYVVPDFVTGEFEPDDMEWFERPITGGDEAKVVQLAIKRRSGEQFLVSFTPPFPRLAGPEPKPVDADRARAIAREVLQAYAVDTIDGDDKSLGLQPPALIAEVVLSDSPRPVQLLVGDVAPPSSTVAASYVARVPEKPGPLLVPQSALAQVMSATSDSLLLQHVFGEKAASNVSKLSLREGPKTTTVTKLGNDWNVSYVASGMTAAPRKLDPAQDAKRLRAFTAALQLPVAQFDPAGVGAHGLGPPSGELKVELNNGQEKHELQLGTGEGSLFWVRRSDLGCALAVPVESWLELKAAIEALAE